MGGDLLDPRKKYQIAFEAIQTAASPAPNQGKKEKLNLKSFQGQGNHNIIVYIPRCSLMAWSGIIKILLTKIQLFPVSLISLVLLL